MNEEIKDLAWEHSQHLESITDCSECYKEKRSKIKLADKCGLAYVGDDDYGQAEFCGKKEDWNRYERRIDWGYLEERSAHPEESYW